MQKIFFEGASCRTMILKLWSVTCLEAQSDSNAMLLLCRCWDNISSVSFHNPHSMECKVLPLYSNCSFTFHSGSQNQSSAYRGQISIISCYSSCDLNGVVPDRDFHVGVGMLWLVARGNPYLMLHCRGENMFGGWQELHFSFLFCVASFCFPTYTWSLADDFPGIRCISVVVRWLGSAIHWFLVSSTLHPLFCFGFSVD